MIYIIIYLGIIYEMSYFYYKNHVIYINALLNCEKKLNAIKCNVFGAITICQKCHIKIIESAT